MRKNYAIYATPKKGGYEFRSHDYGELYTQVEAQEILKKEKGRRGAQVDYVARPYKDEVLLIDEIKQLKKNSERQSVMLAQALKEKNELQGKVTATDATFYVNQIKQLQGDLRIAREQLNDIRVKGREFFEAVKG